MTLQLLEHLANISNPVMVESTTHANPRHEDHLQSLPHRIPAHRRDGLRPPVTTQGQRLVISVEETRTPRQRDHLANVLRQQRHGKRRHDVLACRARATYSTNNASSAISECPHEYLAPLSTDECRSTVGPQGWEPQHCVFTCVS